MTHNPSLYVVATPIGNLGDFSPRAIEILQKVDMILAEDTRHSARLLNHFGIRGPVQSYHEHNESEKSVEVIAAMQAGQIFALISDAGTPCFSDPGARLVSDALSAGFIVCPIPGPSAAITALSAAGLESTPFHFYGFLPAQTNHKQKLLCELQKTTSGSLCFYESPHRIVDTLSIFSEIWGPDHFIVLAKELSKIYETIRKGSIQSLQDWFSEDSKRSQGEFVLLIENFVASEDDSQLTVSLNALLRILLSHLKLKDAVAAAVALSGLPKNLIYERALMLKGETP